jgi:hypothetical protein
MTPTVAFHMNCERKSLNHESNLIVFVATAPCGPGPPHSKGFLITQRRITVGRTPLKE